MTFKDALKKNVDEDPLLTRKQQKDLCLPVWMLTRLYPLSKALRKAFGSDSRLLIQDTPGHCSVAMASLCTGRAIREYFFDGKLPPDNTVCPASETSFLLKNENAMTWSSGDIMNEADMRILQNFKRLGEEIQPFLKFRK
ncbi:hypothetical protein M422DRAFT_41576 [Sphaerobolus stellatus SS14]|nr:hypothetical protein M422DRAFT_41576 [Sphaerobolus stellatus SS14]